MFYTIFAAIVILVFMGTAIIRLLIYTLLCRKNETEVLINLGHEFGSLAMRLSKSVLRVEGQENLSKLPAGRRTFIVSNHESYLDIPCILKISPYPVGFIAKKELGRIPLLGFWIRKTGGVLFNRDDLRHAKDTLFSAVGGQSLDRAVLIFPEGTRNKEGTVAFFKTGSIRIALESDAVILPIAMTGGRKKLEGNGWVVKSGEIKMKVLPPIDTRTAGSQNKGEFSEQLRQIILKAHQELS